LNVFEDRNIKVSNILRLFLAGLELKRKGVVEVKGDAETTLLQN
jgi:hypothetical protein